MTAVRTVALDSVEAEAPVTRTRITRVRCRIHVDANGLSFGDRVLLYRTDAGLTQAQLGSICGLTVHPIRSAEWELGWGVQAETVARIAKALDVDMGALWYGQAAAVRQEATS